MTHTRKYIFLIILLLLAIISNLILGSVIVPKETFIDAFFGKLPADNAYYQIIFAYRIPKIMVAILAGVGLGVSGLLMQNMFKNPIVGPYILGLSSGAGLGVAILILGSTFIGVSAVSGMSISLAAIIGSTVTLLFIVSFYAKTKNTVGLLIVGLMTGIFAGAIISILSYFTQAERLQKYVFWSMGNLGNLSWTEIIILSSITVISLAIIIYYIKPVNTLLLGENYALSMGVDIKKIHFGIILITGLLVGSITAFVGPIAFVGLAVPHMARMLFKTQLMQTLLPASILIGGILMLVCDTIAQVPGSMLALPINSVTAILGAPLVVYMIFKNK